MEKDIKKEEIISYKNTFEKEGSGLSFVSFNSFFKKTERVVAALYLISECFDDEEPLRSELRSAALNILKESSRMSLVQSAVRSSRLAEFLNATSFALSLLAISHAAGFVSEMNFSILKKEIDNLESILKGGSVDNREGHAIGTARAEGFAIDPQFFEVSAKPEAPREEQKQMSFIKDKEDSHNVLYKTPAVSVMQSVPLKKTLPPEQKIPTKNDRRESIIALIRKMKTVSIKDISIHFPDVSEKTIQRELTALVESGTLKRQGDKRWSRYELV